MVESLIKYFLHLNFNASIFFDDDEISYKELKNIVSKIRFVPDKKILTRYVILPVSHSHRTVVNILSLWNNKLVPVLFDPGIKSAELNQLQKEYNFAELSDFKKEVSESPLINSLSPDDEAIVIFTSGSSGRPKAVVHTFRSLFSSVVNTNSIIEQTEKDRWMASLPLQHIGGFMIILRALSFGSDLIIPNSVKVNDLKNSIKKFKPTLVSLVSSQLKRFLDDNFSPPDNLRISLIGGGRIDNELLKSAKNKRWHPYKVYGSTETASFVTCLSENMIEEKPDSAGKALPGTKVFIDKESEIYVQSSSLFKKYLNDEIQIREKVENGTYKTGDDGFIDADGYLFITGRKNRMIISGGKNIDPLEVETSLKKINNIDDAFVIGISDDVWGEKVIAVIETKSKLKIEELISELKKILSDYKIPKDFILVEQIPRTELGKIDLIIIEKVIKDHLSK